MVATLRNGAAPTRRARRAGLVVLGGALVLTAVALAPHTAGQAPRLRNDGLYLPVPAHINDTAVSQIEATVKDALGRQKPSLRVVIFDFNPDDQDLVGTT